jgi:hypothetical protein
MNQTTTRENSHPVFLRAQHTLRGWCFTSCKALPLGRYGVGERGGQSIAGSGMAKRTWLLVWMMVWIRSVGSMPGAGIQMPAAQVVRCARRGDTKPMQHAEHRYLDQVHEAPSAGDREGAVSSSGKVMASTSTIVGSRSSSREVAESEDRWNEDGREVGAEHEHVLKIIRGENSGADRGIPPRVCESCRGKRVSKGVEGPGRTWQSFFCRRRVQCPRRSIPTQPTQHSLAHIPLTQPHDKPQG